LLLATARDDLCFWLCNAKAKGAAEGKRNYDFFMKLTFAFSYAPLLLTTATLASFAFALHKPKAKVAHRPCLLPSR
jgi:hypothetical protein